MVVVLLWWWLWLWLLLMLLLLMLLLLLTLGIRDRTSDGLRRIAVSRTGRAVLVTLYGTRGWLLSGREGIASATKTCRGRRSVTIR